MADRTPAQELAAAADRLDALLDDVTSAPWRYNPDKMWNLPGQHFGEEFVGAGPLDKPICVAATGDADDQQSMVDAAYIAAMNPDVGRALAALLRWTAERWVDAKAVQHHSTRAEMQDLALDLARAILGTREDT